MQIRSSATDISDFDTELEMQSVGEEYLGGKRSLSSPPRRKDMHGAMLPSMSLDLGTELRHAARITADSVAGKSTAKGVATNFSVGGAQRVGHLLHKLAASSGTVPGEHHASKKEKDKVNKIQLQNLDQSEAVKKGFAQLIELYDEVNFIVQDLFYRKDLSTRVQVANDAYLNLFQNILAEILALHREKFKVELSDFESLKHEVIRLHSENSSKNETINEMRSRIAILEGSNDHLQKDYDEIKGKLDELSLQSRNDEISRLENPWKYVSNHFPGIVDEMRDKIHKEQEIIFHEKLAKIKKDVAKDQSQFNLNRARLQRQQMEQERLKREELVKNEITNRMASISTVTTIDKMPTKESSTQTQVDEMGLWDKQDGWVLPISSSEEARKKWRMAFRVATCPQCKGVGGFVAKCATLLRKVSVPVSVYI